ncbi:hypothetical protein N9L19_00425 [bacterium]|nr:hypothetical protein [bacterium]
MHVPVHVPALALDIEIAYIISMVVLMFALDMVIVIVVAPAHVPDQVDVSIADPTA